MATETLDFAAQVDGWVQQTADRMERIWKQSAQELASIAINGTPIDTGFALASWRTSTEAMPMIDPNATNKSGAPASLDFGQITASIANAKLGGQIFVGMTAAYGLPLEYGHSKQAPQGMVRIAAAQWPTIVSQVVAAAKARAA